MKHAKLLPVWALIVAAALLGGHLGKAQNVSQSIILQPGWNAVFLEVQPENNSADTVFAGLPLAGVWTPGDRFSTAEFIQSPSEATFNSGGWLAWYPAGKPESFLRNLFAVHANRPYLIRSTNSTAVTWTVAGRPSLDSFQWTPGAFTLRGLPLDPAAPPTFRNFFRHSNAHYNAATGQLNPIYRLVGGQWTAVSANDAMRSGEAYWIWTSAASDYSGPLAVSVPIGDGLDFGEQLGELPIVIENRSSSIVTAEIRDLETSGVGVLSHRVFDPAQGIQWPELPASLGLPLAGRAKSSLRLAVRRADIVSGEHTTILQIRDGLGGRVWVPVIASTPVATAPARGQTANGSRLAGLWVGTANLTGVSEAHSSNPSFVTPAASGMALRMILHVDGNGQARLLRQVIQMWRDGTYTNDSSGNLVADKAGKFVLLTDDSKIPSFRGAAVRDGREVGRRLSSVGYDFDAPETNNFVPFAGDFAIGSTLSATLSLPFDHPRNPFKHRYHPDHDNLDARFAAPKVESYTVSRQIRLTLASSPPDGNPGPDYGYSDIAGTYAETITGLHKNPLAVGGTFHLVRVSTLSELNPNPLP
jgi:hypothetical protein